MPCNQWFTEYSVQNTAQWTDACSRKAGGVFTTSGQAMLSTVPTVIVGEGRKWKGRDGEDRQKDTQENKHSLHAS